MVMVANGPAAYGPAKTIISLIERFRGPGLPFPLSVESLPRVSVSESLAPRTLQSLKLLGLVDEHGKSTPQFEDLRRAPTAEYKSELIDLLKSAYEPVFEVVEPANATYDQVQDAFRSFNPQGQRDRMVSLFLSLLEYAEYSDSLPSVRSSGSARSAGTNPTQPGTGRNGKGASRAPQARVEPPPLVAPPPGGNAAPESEEDVVINLGDAGEVTIKLKVRWFSLSLPDDTADKLRKGIRELQALSLPHEPLAAEERPDDQEGLVGDAATQTEGAIM